MTPDENGHNHCGECDHRTVFLGWCIKKGKKVAASMGACPMFVLREETTWKNGDAIDGPRRRQI